MGNRGVIVRKESRTFVRSVLGLSWRVRPNPPATTLYSTVLVLYCTVVFTRISNVLFSTMTRKNVYPQERKKVRMPTNSTSQFSTVQYSIVQIAANESSTHLLAFTTFIYGPEGSSETATIAPCYPVQVP